MGLVLDLLRLGELSSVSCVFAARRRFAKGVLEKLAMAAGAGGSSLTTIGWKKDGKQLAEVVKA